MKIGKYGLASLAAMTVMATGLVAFSNSGASATTTYNETTGGLAHTWTNYTNAGDTQGPSIAAYLTVQIACRLTGFRVSDGNTWWYQIASPPWNSAYYVSADAFYNNGSTSGSLIGTPFYDSAVPVCGSSPPPPPPPSTSVPPPVPTPRVRLAQAPPAPSGYRYGISLSGFAANSSVSISCRDSADPSGFDTFSLRTNGSGQASTQTYCYSADGPDHWVVANGIESNHVSWTASTGGGSSGTPPPPAGGGGQVPPSGPGTTATASAPETCARVVGEMANTSPLRLWLYQHFSFGSGRQVVVPWSYFSNNAEFVAEAHTLGIHQSTHWAAKNHLSDIYLSLGTFTITRTSAHCYYIYDFYDFAPKDIPFWLQQWLSPARTFPIQSSGKL